jgi:hypothetical protein
MDDSAHPGLGTGAIKRGWTDVVYGVQRLTRSVLQGPGTIDDGIDALEMLTPSRRTGGASDIEAYMAYRGDIPGRAARDANDSNARGMQPAATAAPIKPVTPTMRTVLPAMRTVLPANPKSLSAAVSRREPERIVYPAGDNASFRGTLPGSRHSGGNR